MTLAQNITRRHFKGYMTLIEVSRKTTSQNLVNQGFEYVLTSSIVPMLIQ